MWVRARFGHSCSVDAKKGFPNRVGKCPNWTSPNFWGYNLQLPSNRFLWCETSPLNKTCSNPWKPKTDRSKIIGSLQVFQGIRDWLQTLRESQRACHGFFWLWDMISPRKQVMKPFTKYDWLVVWTPLKNISQLGWLFPIYGKIKLMFNSTNQMILAGSHHMNKNVTQASMLLWIGPYENPFLLDFFRVVEHCQP